MKAGIALLALGVPMVVGTATANAVAPETCLQHPLAVPAGMTAVSPDAVAPAGRFVVGDGQLSGGESAVVRWHDGVPKKVELPVGSAVAADVSDDGQIVIAAGRRNFRYRDGELEPLATPSGYAEASAGYIDNKHGLIAGAVYDADFWNAHGVVWDATNQPHVLTLPAGFNETRINGIDDDGTVVGAVMDWDYEGATVRSQRAASWRPDGTITLLSGGVEATAVRGGVAVGIESDGTAVKWQLGAGTPATPFDSGRGRPTAINDAGSVLVGDHLLTAEGQRPLEMKDPGGASGIDARDLDDHNQVHGTDRLTDQAVRWDCG
ncbi:hypothetical protein AB0E69_32780 [Kribbella sp. NPDC026611]|uniref:hypothetical protein n=1 Tax=Kribbella sp. NPDC026611 TaxID=3154911 RepID=UPI0033EDECC3